MGPLTRSSPQPKGPEGERESGQGALVVTIFTNFSANSVLSQLKQSIVEARLNFVFVLPTPSASLTPLLPCLVGFRRVCALSHLGPPLCPGRTVNTKPSQAQRPVASCPGMQISCCFQSPLFLSQCPTALIQGTPVPSIGNSWPRHNSNVGTGRGQKFHPHHGGTQED